LPKQWRFRDTETLRPILFETTVRTKALIATPAIAMERAASEINRHRGRDWLVAACCLVHPK
jgi:hypothetical protein